MVFELKLTKTDMDGDITNISYFFYDERNAQNKAFDYIEKNLYDENIILFDTSNEIKNMIRDKDFNNIDEVYDFFNNINCDTFILQFNIKVFEELRDTNINSKYIYHLILNKINDDIDYYDFNNFYYANREDAEKNIFNVLHQFIHIPISNELSNILIHNNFKRINEILDFVNETNLNGITIEFLINELEIQ
jgi:hypothetical protein